MYWSIIGRQCSHVKQILYEDREVFSAYSQIIDWERMSEIAKKVGAYFLVDMAHVSGLVAGGVYPSPVPYADVVTSTTHKTLRGPRGGIIISKSNPELEKKFNSLVFPGTQGGPLMHVIAAKAVAFKEALEPDFKIYMKNVVNNADILSVIKILRNKMKATIHGIKKHSRNMGGREITTRKMHALNHHFFFLKLQHPKLAKKIHLKNVAPQMHNTMNLERKSSPLGRGPRYNPAWSRTRYNSACSEPRYIPAWSEPRYKVIR